MQRWLGLARAGWIGVGFRTISTICSFLERARSPLSKDTRIFKIGEMTELWGKTSQNGPKKVFLAEISAWKPLDWGLGGRVFYRTRTGFLVFIKKGWCMVVVIVKQHLHVQFRDSSDWLTGAQLAMLGICTCILSSRVILKLYSSLERARSPLSKHPWEFELGWEMPEL